MEKYAAITLPPVATRLWLLALLLVAFWLRLTFWVGNVYYTDEFISMLAVQMVAERGLPLLPSGLFYDHGLLYSLLAGSWVGLFGFSEQMARWPVVLVGMLTAAAYFAVARRLFGSPLAGLLALLLVTFDEFMMKWGVWARMYAQAHLFVLLTVTWLLLGTLKRSPHNHRDRWLFLLFLAAMLFSHSLTFALLPPLALLLVVFSLAYRRDWLRDRRLWRQALAGSLIVVAALAVLAGGHVSSTVSYQATAEQPEQAADAGLLAGYFTPKPGLSQAANLFDFYQTDEYEWLLYLIGLALLLSLWRLARRRHTFADVAALFLALLPLLTLYEMGALLADEWQQGRYMVFLTLPFFMLLAAYSLTQLLTLALILAQRVTGPAVRPWLAPAALLALLLIIIPLWGSPAWRLANARATGAFDTAFAFVRQNWQPGDRIMTEQPAAAYVYTNQNDFYANQTSAKVLESEEDYRPPIDRYTGAPLVDTVPRLNQALANGDRLWLVVGDRHLFHYYDPFFRQQIFAQMDFAYQAGSKYVFVSRPHPTPLPPEPRLPLAVNFDDAVLLGGYSADPRAISPDGVLPVALYWQPLGPPPRTPSKVFVQLRDSKNQMVAQADHLIYEGLLFGKEWELLRHSGEWLRSTADLQLPLDQPLDNGPYRLYVGFYNPTTLERVPVINDSSGENAAVLELPLWPGAP